MSIILDQLTKRYDGLPVVNNVSLEIENGEFFVLLGSSGSGKTTILNLIAGLTGLDKGRILLHGRDVTFLPTQQRRVGFVFQNYALFQHMTIAENIEFGLSIQKVPKSQRQARRDELLELIGMSGLGTRMPKQLSGGQQQRVALARALAHEPDVLLLDEPLGALDAKIRQELRRSLKTIQQKLNVTTILVTHDQEEAFDLADRIAVMSYGRLLEVASPKELYQKPKTEFVASFLGSANLLVGRASQGKIFIGPLEFPDRDKNKRNTDPERVQVLYRPEDVTLAAAKDELSDCVLGYGTVEEISFGGALESVRVKLPSISGVRNIHPPVEFGSELIIVDSIRSPEEAERYPLKVGDQAWVGIHRIHTLEHPGLSFLLPIDGTPLIQETITLAGQIARQAQARVTLLEHSKNDLGDDLILQEARKQLGSGLTTPQTVSMNFSLPDSVSKMVEKQPHDVVILGFDPNKDQKIIEQILNSGNHHLLLVPGKQSLPNNVLVPVAIGEPGKDDIQFSGRLFRHLGAEITLLTVILSDQKQEIMQNRAKKFLEDGVRTLSTMGIQANYLIKVGKPLEEITKELNSGKFNLLTLGSPLSGKSGQISLDGLVWQILMSNSKYATLIVRSQQNNRRDILLKENDIPHILEGVR
ncbi:MAG: ATP-binding cassette domain-containing protein [Anaerolineaceae bacterium]|nr:ATP-binding cassette domain-containing protein [Anaerolineaceae bacterium]